MRDVRTLSYESASGGGPEVAPVSSLVVALQLARPAAGSSKHVLQGIERVVVGRGDVASAERDRTAQVPTLLVAVDDPWMSSRHFELVREGESFALLDAGSKNGTLLNGERTARAVLADDDLIEAGGTCFRFRDREPAPGGIAPGVGPAGMRSLDLGLAHELVVLARIAQANVTVLLSGETGTGKEVVARAIHAESKRRGPFVAVNCAALPSTLIAAELFGVKKGGYSGATEDRPGLIRSAEGGTLLLDEIADLPEELQAVLLRVLQEREVTPVGDTRAVKVDVRIIAASHGDLEARVAAGRFRQDLLARLAGFVMELPALRERRDDLGQLVADLLARLSPAGPPGGGAWKLERAAARALLTYAWPSNVRELEQALRSAIALAVRGEIQLAHLPEAVRAAKPEAAAHPQPRTPASAERLRELWLAHGGNVSAIARAMATSRSQVRRLLKKHGLGDG